MGSHEHHQHDRPGGLSFFVMIASDTRTSRTDESGRLIRTLIEGAGHRVADYEIVPDDPARIRDAIVAKLAHIDAIIVSGGTGIASRDSTIEAIAPLLDKRLDGFGEVFRMLSYNDVGPVAIMSRALAGVSKGKLVLAIPGSPAACRLALEKLLIPLLPHIAAQLGLGAKNR